LTSGVFSVANQQFDVTGAAVTFTSGSLAFRTTGLLTQAGSESIIGETSVLTANAGLASIVKAGAIQTLTIPIDSMLVITLPPEQTSGIPITANLHLVGQLVATATLPAVPGDFDSDGDVDGADFVAWQTNFPKATGATLSQGDADGDHDVDGADFVVWQTNFPYNSAPGASPVPEPASIYLVLALAVGVVAIRRLQASRTAARGL
jgi:hypothetical protein